MISYDLFLCYRLGLASLTNAHNNNSHSYEDIEQGLLSD